MNFVSRFFYFRKEESEELENHLSEEIENLQNNFIEEHKVLNCSFAVFK